MNLILLMFSLFTTAIIISSSILNCFQNSLPVFFNKCFRYGKFACKENVPGVIELPKSFFKQFYWVAVLAYIYSLYEATLVYVFNKEPTEGFLRVLESTCGKERISYKIPMHAKQLLVAVLGVTSVKLTTFIQLAIFPASATNVYISLVLLNLQTFRRFYDTHFVSVFGKNSKINVTHYITGMLHYPGSALAIICEAPQFATNSPYATTNLNLYALSYVDIFAILLFTWAWWHQHVTTEILADLRKNKKGNIVTSDHKLPYGDWFEYLSAPHQTAEILMYLSITILLWYNITWFFVFTWVLSNQVETILLSHWWYQDTFEKFPKKRKALIPFFY